MSTTFSLSPVVAWTTNSSVPTAFAGGPPVTTVPAISFLSQDRRFKSFGPVGVSPWGGPSYWPTRGVSEEARRSTAPGFVQLTQRETRHDLSLPGCLRRLGTGLCRTYHGACACIVGRLPAVALHLRACRLRGRGLRARDLVQTDDPLRRRLGLGRARVLDERVVFPERRQGREHLLLVLRHVGEVLDQHLHQHRLV